MEYILEMLAGPATACPAPQAGSASSSAGADHRSLIARAPVPSAFSQPWEWCDDCGVSTEESTTSPQEAICPECGRVFTCPTVEETAVMNGNGSVPSVRPAPALTVVGKGSASIQGVFDSASVTNPDDTASAEIYRELVRYNHEYTGEKFSEAILRQVAEFYAHEVRKQAVCRAQCKQGILANLVYQIGLEQGCPRNPQDCAVLLRLHIKGLARGEALLRTMGVCDKLLKTDNVSPWVDNTFQRMGMGLEELMPPSQELVQSVSLVSAVDKPLLSTLRKAAMDILNTGEKLLIGINQRPHTRAVCAVYVVVRRAAVGGLLPKNWNICSDPHVTAGKRGSIEWAGEVCKIRPQTMKNHIKVLADYHSHFAPVYQNYGLFDARQEKL